MERIQFSKIVNAEEFPILEEATKEQLNDLSIHLLAENKRLRETLNQAKQKSQIFASHIAYCKDKYYSVDPMDTFNKAQDIYELLDEALRDRPEE